MKIGFIVPGNNDTRRRGISFPKNLVLEDALAISNQVPTSVITDAFPIIIPSIVNELLNLFETKVFVAMPKASFIEIFLDIFIFIY